MRFFHRQTSDPSRLGWLWKTPGFASRVGHSLLLMLTQISETAAIICFIVTVTAVAVCDLREFRIPDLMLLPGATATFLLFTLSNTSDFTSLNRAMFCASISLLAYLLLYLSNPGQLGFGDVKLAGLIGLVTGWFGVGLAALATLAAFLAAGTAVIVLIMLRSMRLQSHFALGPWLALGGFAAIASQLAK